MTISDAQWDAAAAALGSASAVSLACHVGPDGDALGSMLALGLALRERGASVSASWGSGDGPFEVPRAYGFLPGLDLLVKPDAFPASPGLMVTFDAGSFERLGSLEPNARAAGALLVVDHHASNDAFGSINLVDADAAASAVIVYRLLQRLGIDATPEVATCLYAGLVTDTGRFQHANTTPEVHRIAADLLARGADRASAARQIYETNLLGFFGLASQVLGRVRTEPDASVVWSFFTQADLATFELPIEETESLIDLVRTAEGFDVAVMLKQDGDGAFRVSMRSRGATDVGALCESMGGGGHRLAAGFTADGAEPEAIIGRIVAALR